MGIPEMGGAGDVYGRRSGNVSRAALGAEHRLAALRLHFHDGTPVSVLHARVSIAMLWQHLAQAGFEYRRRARSRVPYLQDPKISGSRRKRSPGHPSRRRSSPLTHGSQYLTEVATTRVEPVLEILRQQPLDLGLPLGSLEWNSGPSQFEFTFGPTSGLQPADLMILFRTAAKEIVPAPAIAPASCAARNCPTPVQRLASAPVAASTPDGPTCSRPRRRRRTVAARPRYSSPACSTTPAPRAPSPRRRSMAIAATAPFDRPGPRPVGDATIAPSWSAPWAGPAIRRRGRRTAAGEPAANPYLYMASQAFAGLDGVDHAPSRPAADAPYETPPQPCRPRSPKPSRPCAPTVLFSAGLATVLSTISAASRRPRSAFRRPPPRPR